MVTPSGVLLRQGPRDDYLSYMFDESQPNSVWNIFRQLTRSALDGEPSTSTDALDDFQVGLQEGRLMPRRPKKAASPPRASAHSHTLAVTAHQPWTMRRASRRASQPHARTVMRSQ